MAVQNDTSRIQYNGNNSTVNAYAIPFPFFENSHIRAVVTNSAGVDTELALGSGFTLTGAGNPNGGSLVTVAAVPASSKVTIFRNVPATQTTSYQEGGDFPAASHERALDKLTMVAQQNKRLGERSIRVSEAGTSPSELTALPNTVLGLDANRNPKAMTVDEVKSYLALTGTTLDVNAGMKTFADSGERALAVPEFTGQLATQRDTKALYVATGTTAGAWQLFDIGDSAVVPRAAQSGRPLKDVLAERVNVLDYGAKPNMFAFNGSISGTTLTITSVIGVTVDSNGVVYTGYDGGGYPLLPKIEVGMIIDSPNVTTLTRVEELLTGTGGVGTYRVSVSQNVSTQYMEAWYDNRLPLARAIAGSKFPDSAEVVKNWTFDTMTNDSNGQATPTHPVGQDQRQVPSLIFQAGPGGRDVYIPFGRYKISGPLYVTQGTRIVGENARSVQILCFRKQQFNFFEDFFVWIQRQESGKNWAGQTVSWDSPHWIVSRGAFNANLFISGLTIAGNLEHTDTIQYDYYQWPLYYEAGYTLCAGTQGGTTVTLSGPGTISNGQLYVGMKFRIKGNSAVYEIGSVAGNTLTLKAGQTLNHTFTGKILLIGLHAQNGIMCSGGEDAVIEHCFCNEMGGAGVYQTHGSPAATIRDTMCNGNDIAFRIDVGPALLLKPSGDHNNVFLQSGILGFAQTTMIGCKIEGSKFFQAQTPNPPDLGGPYPFLESNRCLFELGAGYHTIIGGSCNDMPGSSTFTGQGQIADNPVVSAYSGNSFLQFPVIQILNFWSGNYGTMILRTRNSNTNAIVRTINRTSQIDADSMVTVQSVPHFEGNYIGGYLDNLTNLRLRAVRNGNDQTTWCGIMVDQGATNSYGSSASSGMRNGLATFTRSNDTVTFTYTNHGLQVGDYVDLRLSNVDVVANFTNVDSNGTTAYSNLVYRVMTVPNANSFTITVANAGPTTGSAKINAYQFVALHDIKDGEHRIQMPDVIGNVTSSLIRPALTIYDKQRRPISGLRVFNATQGEWWASHKLTVGGSMPFPATELSSEDIELTMTGADVQTFLLPAGRICLGVTVRVTQAITGATSFKIGEPGDDDKWGDAIGIALNTTTTPANFTVPPPYLFAANTNVILTATGGNFTGGKVKVMCHFLALNPPNA
jgi:hypothetical protein